MIPPRPSIISTQTCLITRRVQQQKNPWGTNSFDYTTHRCASVDLTRRPTELSMKGASATLQKSQPKRKKSRKFYKNDYFFVGAVKDSRRAFFWAASRLNPTSS